MGQEKDRQVSDSSNKFRQQPSTTQIFPRTHLDTKPPSARHVGHNDENLEDGHA